MTDTKTDALTRQQAEMRRCLLEAAKKWRSSKPNGMSERELIDLAKPCWKGSVGIFSATLARREIESLLEEEQLERTPSWQLKLGWKAPAESPSSKTVFEKIPQSEWVLSNELAFAIEDAYPVSKGHMLFITRRPVQDWFAASPKEQDAIFALIEQAKEILDKKLSPDGYNIGMNCGEAAGQTVMHLHVHLIPRFKGDTTEPRGGVRHAIPERGSYVSGKPTPPPSQGTKKSKR